QRHGEDVLSANVRMTGPDPWQDLKELFHHSSPPGEVGTERLVLDVDPCQAQAESEAAMAEEYDGGGVLGEAQRVVERGEDHPGPDLDRGGGRGEGSAHHRQ